MIHTLELTKSISKKNFDLVAHIKNEELQNNGLNISRKLGGSSKSLVITYDNKKLKNIDVRRGVNYLKLACNNYYCYAYIAVNVSHLIGYSEPRKAIRICEKDFDNIYLKLKELTKYICEDIYNVCKANLYTCGEFLINRIDYAVDIKTPYADEYVRLLKKGNVPRGLKDIGYENNLYYSNRAKRMKLHRVVNCYNKSKSARKNGIKAEENILRFEVQLGINQIEKVLEKYNLQYYKEYIKTKSWYFLFEVSPYVLQIYYKQLVHNSSFYTKKAIENETIDLSKNIQNKIKRFLVEITKKGASIRNLKKYHKEAIKKLKEMDINPIPLKASIGKKKLDGLHGYFRDL